MKNGRHRTLDFRYYDMPQRDSVLTFAGDSWRREYGLGFREQLHFHNIIEIGICHEGYGKMVYEDGSEKEFEPGLISVIPRNVPHNTLSRPGTIGFWEYIFFDEDYFLERRYGQDPILLDRIKSQINSGILLLKEREHPEIRNVITGILGEHNSKEAYSRQLKRSLADALLLLIAREGSTNEEGSVEERHSAGHRVIEAMNYIDRHYMENLTIGQLAMQCGMSETGFRRRFTAYINMSPVEYVNVIRVRKACELLRDTDYSMDMIAQKVGYTTPSTFNRNFRHFVGTSPYQWKKSNDILEDSSLKLKIDAHRGWE
jgi:AraC-like DNA-binding protein